MIAVTKRVAMVDGRGDDQGKGEVEETCIYRLVTEPENPINVHMPELGTIGDAAISLDGVSAKYYTGISQTTEAKPPANAKWTPQEFVDPLFEYDPADPYWPHKINPVTAKLQKGVELI